MSKKITTTIMLMVSLSLFFNNNMFSKNIINSQERALAKILEDFGDKYDVFFSYEKSMVKDIKVEFEFIENEEIYVALDRLLGSFDLDYDTFGEKYIVIFQKSAEAQKDLTKLKRHFKEIEKIESKGLVKVFKNKSKNKHKKNALLSQVLKEVENISVEKAILSNITGNVTDANGEPLIGVNILIKGTGKGTVTDIDGNYTIDVSEGATLLFSYIGFVTQEITLTEQTSLNVVLVVDSESLEEIVVVGYGIKRKSHLTGSIAKIGGDDIASVQSTRVDEALAGRLAGVQVQNTDPQPGAAPKIKVRSGGSITGAGNPLIVVDGYPISGDLSTVNPSDVESIEVLKDASSAAIYGSRGANGVIMVTTKKGRSYEPQFSYNTYLSSASAYRKNYPIYTTLSEHIETIEANSQITSTDDANGWPMEATITSDTWATQKDLGSAAGFENYDVLFAARLKLYKEIEALGLETDYLDNALQTGITQNHDINVRGGSDKVRYFASVGYLGADGTIQKSDYDRYTGRLNLDANLNDKLKAGFSFNGLVSKRNQFVYRLGDAIRTQSVVPKFHTAESIALVQEYDQYLQSLPNYVEAASEAGGSGPGLYELQPGDYGHEWHFNRRNHTGGIANGVGLSFFNGAQSKIDNRSNIENTYFGNFISYIGYEIIEGLNFKTNLGADMRNFATFDNIEAAGTENGIGETVQNESTQFTTSWLSQNTLDYSKDFGMHNVNLLAGYEFGQQQYNALFVAGSQYSADGLFTYGSINDVQTQNLKENTARKSVFARAGYVYDDKYLFSASIRRDGDSRFGANNQWANFPAISAGWNLHNEDFFDAAAIDKLKLRASFGKLGSTEGLGAYDALSSVQTVTTTLGGANVIGFTNSNVANPNLSWQITSERNFGADFSFLDYRFNLSVDYFTSTTEDMLLQKQISAVTGFTSTNINQGSLKSNGLEIELGATVLSTADFTWKLSGNFSKINTQITDTGNEAGFAIHPDNRLPEFRTYTGGQISEFWGYETTGEEIADMYQLNPGYPINRKTNSTYVVDQNGDGIINSDDYIKLGSNAPDFTWGLYNQVSHNDFDLSFVFQGSHGAEVANTDDFFYGAHWKGVTNSLFAETEGSNLVAEKVDTDLFIQSASFVALRNITLGYTLKGDKLSSKLNFDNVRFYLASSNLLYLFADDYTGLNPEGVNYINPTNPIEFGGQRGASPISRSFTVGLNFNF